MKRFDSIKYFLSRLSESQQEIYLFLKTQALEMLYAKASLHRSMGANIKEGDRQSFQIELRFTLYLYFLTISTIR